MSEGPDANLKMQHSQISVWKFTVSILENNFMARACKLAEWFWVSPTQLHGQFCTAQNSALINSKKCEKY
jgi:hypothetical protein